jgi:hypothetical protein
MSIFEKRMPSLKDKIIKQDVKEEEKVEEVDEVEIKKGRRLNK